MEIIELPATASDKLPDFRLICTLRAPRPAPLEPCELRARSCERKHVCGSKLVAVLNFELSQHRSRLSTGDGVAQVDKPVHALQGGSELRRGRHRALRARILARNRKFPARASKKAREPLKLIEDSPTRTSSSSQVSLRDRSRALRPAPARYPNAAQPRAGGRKTQKTPALRRRRKRDVVPAVHTEGGRARELPAPA